MADEVLSGARVAFLATEGVERVELTGPWAALEGAGATVHLVSPDDGVQTFDHLDKSDRLPVDVPLADADVADYDALVLPGGVANPDALRMDDDAVSLVRSFLDADKLVAAICHAPWLLVEADAVRGRRITSWPSVETDLRNAGAEWVDEQVVVDTDDAGQTLITSRNPDDVPAFGDAIISALAEA